VAPLLKAEAKVSAFFLSKLVLYLNLFFMKKLLSQHYELIITLFAAVVFLLCIINVLPFFSYAIVIIPIAFYFFPFRIIFRKEFNVRGSQRFMLLLASYVLSYIFAFAFIINYLTDKQTLLTVLMIAVVVNSFFVYYLIKKDLKQLVLPHIAVNALALMAIWV